MHSAPETVPALDTGGNAMEKTIENFKNQLLKLLSEYDLPVDGEWVYAVSYARYKIRRRQQAGESPLLRVGEYTGIVEYDPINDLFFGTTMINKEMRNYESENYKDLQEPFEEALRPRSCKGWVLWGEECAAKGRERLVTAIRAIYQQRYKTVEERVTMGIDEDTAKIAIKCVYPEVDFPPAPQQDDQERDHV